MTEYLKGRFSVPLMGSKQYRDNWDAIFGKKEESPLAELTRLTEEIGGYDAEMAPTPKSADADIPESKRSETSDESKPSLTEDEDEVTAGHHKLPGGGVRRPRGWLPTKR